MAVLSLICGIRRSYRTMGYATTATTTTDQVTTRGRPRTAQAPEVLEKVVVTGSNIPKAADALAIPVATVTSTPWRIRAVAADTLDLLRKVAPNISGVGQDAPRSRPAATSAAHR
jgi:hypothetical protein